jgi:ATP-dependent DNA helicase PIF1
MDKKDIELNDDQMDAYRKIVKEKKNIFLTGLGGCGKTFLLQLIAKNLYSKKNIVLTSLTGVSAQILGGCTLHSYLGIGLGKASFEKLYKKILLSKFYLRRWKTLDILVIDEVSMLSIELFEKIEKLARRLRKNDKPFGEIQLIFSGDFLQLPTINDDKFCFETPLWDICIDEIVELKTTMRQKDAIFIRVLNKVRHGEIDDECRELLKSREIKYISDTGLIPTMLYATNAKVDATNEKYYSKLTGEEYVYKISFKWHQKGHNKEILENNTRFLHEISLKVGTQIMFLINDRETGQVNGSRGIVKGFADASYITETGKPKINKFPYVLFVDGKSTIITPHTLSVEIGDDLVMSYTQLPLRLSWAMTIHKSQGCTLDLLRVDIHNIFKYGQFYVALSRAKDLQGLYIRNLDFNRCYTHPKAVEFYKKLQQLE